jgi:hypothetical protein
MRSAEEEARDRELLRHAREARLAIAGGPRAWQQRRPRPAAAAAAATSTAHMPVTGDAAVYGLSHDAFMATRTSTMDPSDLADSSSYSTDDSESDREATSSRAAGLVLAFEVPHVAAFRQVVETFYRRVAPEKDAGAKGAEAVRLAARQQQKLLRQHAPTISPEGAQQHAFRQIFALLRKKYTEDPLTIWRHTQGAPGGRTAQIARTASVRERELRAAVLAPYTNLSSHAVYNTLTLPIQATDNSGTITECSLSCRGHRLRLWRAKPRWRARQRRESSQPCGERWQSLQAGTEAAVAGAAAKGLPTDVRKLSWLRAVRVLGLWAAGRTKCTALDLGPFEMNHIESTRCVGCMHRPGEL